MNPETIEFAKRLAQGARKKAYEDYLRLLAIRGTATERQEPAQASGR